ncbi:serpin family protein [Dysgonomonas massiliensis]|uniref:serpin family protein n=1 Tax=Dysgonomonas massiliensis TaxID=2040292 RepID=UPI001359DB3D|nr:serpin family protein [Dysgonomonas massiliensis]
MKGKFYLMFIVLLSAGFFACSDDDGGGSVKYPKGEIKLSAEQEDINQNAQKFAWKLFANVYKSEAPKGKNILVSPLSFNYALGMLQNGAAGETLNEILKTLEFEGKSIEAINEFYRLLEDEMDDVDRSLTLETANSFWYREDVPVVDDFIATNKKYYDAEVSAQNFEDPNTVNIINNWCADNTNGKITKVIERIDREMIYYLINAVYFKGKWEQQFSKKDTKTATFTLADNTKVEAQFMNQEIEDSPYFENDALSYSALNFGNGAYQMFFALPKENTEMEQVLNVLSDIRSDQQQPSSTVEYVIPKFETEYNINLIPIMRSMGMTNIFSLQANFRKLADIDNFVAILLQKTYIKIDEEGGEAAGITVVGGMETSIEPTQSVLFKLDRPFLYGIRETSTGTILFLGHLANPLQTK